MLCRQKYSQCWWPSVNVDDCTEDSVSKPQCWINVHNLFSVYFSQYEIQTWHVVSDNHMAGILKGVGATTLSHKNMLTDFNPHENYIHLKYVRRELINPQPEEPWSPQTLERGEGHPVRRAWQNISQCWCNLSNVDSYNQDSIINCSI